MKRMRTLVWGAAGVLSILVLWTVLSQVVGTYVIPAPWTTFADTARLLVRPDTRHHILITVARIAAGFGLAFVAGCLAGLAAGSREADAFLRPGILLMQGVPPILWAIPLILILGWSGASPVVVIALICFPLVAGNVAEGVKSVPERYRAMLDVFAPGRYARIRDLTIPYLRPFVAAAVRLGLTLGIKASVVAEYFGANDGIGFQVQTAYQAFQVRRLFAWALVLVALILVFDRALARAVRAAAAVSSAGRGRQRRLLRHAHADRQSAVELRRRFDHPSPECGVELVGVSFGYPEMPPLFQEIHLRLDATEVAVVYGDSGVGKTTLLNVIAGLLSPNAGRVNRPSGVGFVFQDDRLLPWRTNVYNVAIGLRYRGLDQRSVYEFACSMIEAVGLAGREHDYPGELSGGMKKRLAFARCFAALPNLVLMDEPFSGLHRSARRDLWALFAELVRRHPVPVVIVTHFPEEVPEELGSVFYRLSGRPARLMGPDLEIAGE